MLNSLRKCVYCVDLRRNTFYLPVHISVFSRIEGDTVSEVAVEIHANSWKYSNRKVASTKCLLLHTYAKAASLEIVSAHCFRISADTRLCICRAPDLPRMKPTIPGSAAKQIKHIKSSITPLLLTAHGNLRAFSEMEKFRAGTDFTDCFALL